MKANLRMCGSNVGHLLQLRDIQGRTDIAQHAQGGIIHQHDAEQREGNPDGTEDQVFPAGLQRFSSSPEGDEKRRRQRRRLDRHPLHPQTVRDGRHHHREQEHMKEKKKQIEPFGRDHASGDLFVHIGTHVERTGQSDRPDNEQNERRQRIDIDELSQCRDRTFCSDRPVITTSAATSRPMLIKLTRGAARTVNDQAEPPCDQRREQQDNHGDHGHELISSFLQLAQVAGIHAVERILQPIRVNPGDQGRDQHIEEHA